MVRHLPQNQLV